MANTTIDTSVPLETTPPLTVVKPLSAHVPTTVYLLVAGSVVVGVILGIVIDPYLPKSISNTKKNFERGYQSGFNEVKTRVEKSTVGRALQSSGEIRAIAGTVKAVNGNKLTLHTQPVNPFDDTSLTDRVIDITSSTTILRIIRPADTEKPKTLRKETTYPSLMATSSKLSDIKVGEMLNVFSKVDIRTVKEFSASSIQILTKPVQ
jgi:hypothetical protein